MGRIKSFILAGNDDPFAYVEIDEAKLVSDPAMLADELNAISLMGGKRCIAIRAATDKLAKIIEAAAGYFHPAVFVIAVADELSTRSALRSWFEKEPKAAAVACYKDEVRDVTAVVRAAMSEAGIALDRDAMDYLAGQLGNDRYVTRQELEKIITYAGENKTLALEDIQALVDYNRDTDLDELVNAVADKNLKSMEKTITLLAREGASPVAYMRSLQRYFNRLYGMRIRVHNGENIDAVIASARPPVFFRQVPVMTRHLQQWDVAQIAKALKLLVEAELACKTSDLPALPASGRKLMQVTQVR
jgi:DNA polymerase-3 subunit delta